MSSPTENDRINIGIYTSPAILVAKMEDRRPGRKAEATWNVRRLPAQMAKMKSPGRLFFACQGCWRGYFRLAPEVLFNPTDTDKPYSLIFDLNSWTEIEPHPVHPFRGFRYLSHMPR
jgi:hypothetical protein